MKKNDNKITGVLQYKKSAKHYQLHRYYPPFALSEFIEQYWFVDWDLSGKASHTQINLPDPNFHLVFDGKTVKVLGPVSKLYSYEMKGKGRLIGVKFKLAALAAIMPLPPADYVNQELAIKNIFTFEESWLIEKLSKLEHDKQCIDLLNSCFYPHVTVMSRQQVKLQELVEKIQTGADIFNVEQLSRCTNISVRTIQRYFNQYLGLSPKWLIRRYRLHQALEDLENKDVDISRLVEKLQYTDQSHMIRDFKNIIGITPSQYSSQNRCD